MIEKTDIFNNLNEGMLDERSRAFFINLEKNLPLIREWGGLSGVVPALEGRNVVVIGAGPSLENSLPLLKKYQKRQDLVYIAADMALAPLAEAGILPRYVITCETTPSAFFSGIDTSSMHLLSFSCSSAVNVRAWTGKISFYNWMMNGEPYDSLWLRAGMELGSVSTGSIVTTQAVSIALGCGISSLTILGNDMAFRDRYYCGGTVSARRRFMNADRFSPLVSVDMDAVRRSRDFEVRRGDLMYYTNNQFLAAKMWLEDLFKKGDYPAVDCSVPGCSATAVVKMSFADFIGTIDKKRKRRRR